MTYKANTTISIPKNITGQAVQYTTGEDGQPIENITELTQTIPVTYNENDIFEDEGLDQSFIQHFLSLQKISVVKKSNHPTKYAA